ncbi:MAG: DNA starvation/stationary phase protection protein [Coxiellaceae bacterium]|nr:DNA starvation/stationary phase protection protein [Coxiellaceae bacterium]|tara:strand:- start:9813 stop:10286 length:474 start_codon:yes stop_codon:yes gene_type:complete
MDIHIGISDEHREEITNGLVKVLADSYTLYLKTHNFHWNVEGPLFSELHQLFEKQYLELAIAIDEIAERIRALGFYVPASYSQFSEITTVKEEKNHVHSSEMISQLVLGQEEVVRSARKLIPIAEKYQDQPTADMLIDRMTVHEKNAWMLRSLLEES